MRKVAILGGGVGGLSAAQELVERGFDVEVYEARDVPGGKARSFLHTPPGEQWEVGLPAEHGFRFIPGFYRHLPDTMGRIAAFEPGKTVLDNLAATKEMALARDGLPPIVMPMQLPGSVAELKEELERLFHDQLPDFRPNELEHYAERIWQVLTSCHDRRNHEYEQTGWWEFIGAAQRSFAYRKYLGNLCRTLVAANPHRVSTRTNGNVFLQMLLDFGRLGMPPDRVLKAPTNEAWIHPWVNQLVRQGCRYYLNTKVTALECSGGRIAGARIEPVTTPPMYGGVAGATQVLECDRYRVTRSRPLERGGPFTVDADYYISALPVEAMAALVDRPLTDADPSLGKLPALAKSTAWMNGLLFYLEDDVPIVQGHTIYVDPPWALTSISQRQFWEPDNPIGRYAGGTIGGVLSVDISNWTERDPAASEFGQRLACDCSPEEIVTATWKYLERCVPGLAGTRRLHAVLDPAIVGLLRPRPKNGAPEASAGTLSRSEDWRSLYSQQVWNLEPLLVNEVNTLSLRPNAYTRVPNLFLAADYVRTETDLATMEGANEAARRAVNALLDATGSRAPKCRLWKLREPWPLAFYRWLDQRRFDQGLPWRNPSPWLFRLGHWLWKILHRLLPAALRRAR